MADKTVTREFKGRARQSLRAAWIDWAHPADYAAAMNSAAWLFALLLLCGCASSRCTCPPKPSEALTPQEQRLITNLTNGLSQASTLGAVLRDVDRAWAMTSQNIANAHTVAYKRIIPTFEQDAVLVCRRSFAQGDLVRTGEPLDVAILGAGFFAVQLPDGSKGYTRNGSFRVRQDGRLVTMQGYVLTEWTALMPNRKAVKISSTGLVTEFQAHGEVSSSVVLHNFNAPAELSVTHDGLFLETTASGPAFMGNPKEDGMGELQQGFLETSNVQLDEEVSRLTSLAAWKREIQSTIGR